MALFGGMSGWVNREKSLSIPTSDRNIPSVLSKPSTWARGGGCRRGERQRQNIRRGQKSQSPPNTSLTVNIKCNVFP